MIRLTHTKQQRHFKIWCVCVCVVGCSGWVAGWSCSMYTAWILQLLTSQHTEGGLLSIPAYQCHESLKLWQQLTNTNRAAIWMERSTGFLTLVYHLAYSPFKMQKSNLTFLRVTTKASSDCRLLCIVFVWWREGCGAVWMMHLISKLSPPRNYFSSINTHFIWFVYASFLTVALTFCFFRSLYCVSSCW